MVLPCAFIFAPQSMERKLYPNCPPIRNAKCAQTADDGEGSSFAASESHACGASSTFAHEARWVWDLAPPGSSVRAHSSSPSRSHMHSSYLILVRHTDLYLLDRWLIQGSLIKLLVILPTACRRSNRTHRRARVVSILVRPAAFSARRLRRSVSAVHYPRFLSRI
jgi:hypothetical protein